MIGILRCFCGGPAALEQDSSVFAGQVYSGRYPEPVASQPNGYKVRCVICGLQTCWWHIDREAIENWNRPIRHVETRIVHLFKNMYMITDRSGLGDKKIETVEIDNQGSFNQMGKEEFRKVVEGTAIGMIPWCEDHAQYIHTSFYLMMEVGIYDKEIKHNTINRRFLNECFRGEFY